jgi:predicted lipid-binding transport protein (Tim44 family)
VLATIVALTSPAVAYARGGGGSHGFSGGGHSGGGGGGFHGGVVGGVGGGGSVGVVVFIILLIVIALIYSRVQQAKKKRSSNTQSDRVAHRSDEQASARAAQVEAQVDVLSDTDASFNVAALKQRASWLYVTAQRAWTDRDHATLSQILSPVLYRKWSEELRDYESRGEVNVVEILSGPTVEMVDVANRKGEQNDTVTFRITARLNDYVRRNFGSDSRRTDGSTNPIEYWTLRKNDAGEWIVSSIEQAAEGAHHLTSKIEIDGWDQKEVAREAVLEVAEKTSAKDVPDILSLTGFSWSTDADSAASDLSLIDARFDKSVLEVAIEQFIEEWTMNDGSLDFTPVRTVNRTVLRDAAIESIEVRSLVSREPIVFRVAVGAQGVYYEVDRRTEEVLQGDALKRRPLAFAFDLRLDGPEAKGWTVVGAEVDQAGAYRTLGGIS